MTVHVKRILLFTVIIASFAGALILDWRSAGLMVLAWNADKLLDREKNR